MCHNIKHFEFFFEGFLEAPQPIFLSVKITKNNKSFPNRIWKVIYNTLALRYTTQVSQLLVFQQLPVYDIIKAKIKLCYMFTFTLQTYCLSLSSTASQCHQQQSQCHQQQSITLTLEKRVNIRV